jgi:hypothetical protein
MPSLGYAWLERVDEYNAKTDAVERYVRQLENQLPERIPARRVAELDLVATLENTMVTTDAAREARARLIGAAQRCG